MRARSSLMQLTMPLGLVYRATVSLATTAAAMLDPLPPFKIALRD